MEIQAYSSTSMLSKTMEKQTFGAQVVSKTIDTMNQNKSAAAPDTSYDFQSTVLQSAFSDKGSIIDIIT